MQNPGEGMGTKDPDDIKEKMEEFFREVESYKGKTGTSSDLENVDVHKLSPAYMLLFQALKNHTLDESVLTNEKEEIMNSEFKDKDKIGFIAWLGNMLQLQPFGMGPFK